MNLFRQLSTLVFAASISAVASALTVSVTPGSLREEVGAEASTATALVVNGALDASDFEFVRYDMPGLVSLDLSGASVASYSGPRLANGRTASAENVLPEYAFTGSAISEIVLPQGITAIGEGAFAASAIKNITIPSSVVSLGVSAFADCADLETITLPESVTSIGKGAFRNCPKIDYVVINAQLSEIPSNAFSGCVSLKTVFFPTSLAVIGREAFSGSGIEQLALSKCGVLSEIGKWAFANCDALRAVWMPSSAVNIREGAFFHNVSLTSDLENMVAGADSIADYAFTDNAGMTVTDFDKASVSYIGDYAVRGFSSVGEISLPETLEHIGTQAMANWEALDTIDVRKLGTTVPTLGEEVWKGVDRQKVQLKVTTPQADLYSDTPQWKEFSMFIADPTAIDDVVADSEKGCVTGRISGDILALESSGAEIAGFQLYDMSGRMIAMPQTSPSHTVSAGIGYIDAPVLVVRVLLSDSSVQVLKLAR